MILGEELDEYNESFLERPFTVDPEEVQSLILLNLIELRKEISKLNVGHRNAMSTISTSISNRMQNIAAEFEMYFHRIR